MKSLAMIFLASICTQTLLGQQPSIFPLKVDLPEQITSPCRTATIATACPIPSINGDVRYYLYYVDELGAEELVSWNYTGSFQGVYPILGIAYLSLGY